MEKENNTEREAAQGAEARQQEGAAAFGKFRSAEALLNAYNSLEAEFTRRSQRLRELEGREAARTPETENVRAEENAEADEPPAAKRALGAQPGGEEFRKEVERAVNAYLSKERPPYLMAEGGAFSAAPAQKVHTLEEAGALAAAMFRKIE